MSNENAPSAADRGSKLTEGLGPLVEQLAALARQEHYYCEDPWYTCPAHPEGSANDTKPEGVCDCGADAHNAKVDALRLSIAGLLQGPNALSAVSSDSLPNK